MVAQTVTLPNIKKLFLPDLGFTIADADLAQADAQVVAWEADDEPLKQIFRDPNLDLHNENAKAIFGTLTPRNRQLAKGGVHAINYGAKPRTLAKALGITVHEAEKFTKSWFGAHPNIRDWHYSVEMQLAQYRRVTNRFGNMRYYFDRVEHLLPEALAWIPQSTVALVIERGLVNLDTRLPEVDVLMQVHDSVVFQYPTHRQRDLLPKIKECLEITIPYDDPLVIPVGIEVSTVSWGDCKEIDWNGNFI